MCTTLYLLNLSVWAGRKSINRRQCIFLITRMSVYYLPWRGQETNLFIHVPTCKFSACHLNNQRGWWQVYWPTRCFFSRDNKCQYKIPGFSTSMCCFCTKTSHSNQSHYAFCLGYLQTSQRISAVMWALVNLHMATKAVESSTRSFTVTISPFYFITSAINKEYPESCTRLLSSCQSREQNCS